MSTEEDTLTITLTDRPPLRVVKPQWPVIASADAHDGREYESQANRRWTLRVRQNADGRAVVYGTYSTNWQGEHDRRAGELMGARGDIVTAIRRVAEAIGAPDRLAAECIANLPPEDA
jgi:hypothetical protein